MKRNSIRMLSICLVIAALFTVFAFASGTISIAAAGSKYITSKSMIKNGGIYIKQTSSTNSVGVRWVLAKSSTGLACDSDYLYGKDDTTLYAGSTATHKLTAYNDQSYSINVSYSSP